MRSRAWSAVAVLVWWATDQGGYFQKTFYPGTRAAARRPGRDGSRRARELPRPAAHRRSSRSARWRSFTAWSFLSISWADAPGPAWDAANRALLYLVLFTLFSRAPAGALTRRLLIGAWTLAIVGLAVVVLLKLPARAQRGRDAVRARAGAAAGLLERQRRAVADGAVARADARPRRFGVPPWLRGVFAAGVVVLAETSLLSESRGSLVAVGVVLVVLFAVVPRRVRTFLTLGAARDRDRRDHATHAAHRQPASATTATTVRSSATSRRRC